MSSASSQQFVAIETRYADGPAGRIFRSAKATSSISQSDAQQKAAALAQADVNAAVSGRGRAPHERERYPYGVRDLTEPQVETVSIRGEQIARITENNYGALVLNAARVMFVDVDIDQTARDPRTGRVLTSNHTTTQDEALSALADLVASRPELSFRVYSTAAGLRYLCVSKVFQPDTPESEDILTRLKSDPRYILLCRKQKCYRARLTPKPWRCHKVVTLPPAEHEAAADAAPKGFFAKLFGSSTPKPRTKTLSEPEDFATCRYVETVGAPVGQMLPEIAEIVRVHDRHSEAVSTKPLA